MDGGLRNPDDEADSDTKRVRFGVLLQTTEGPGDDGGGGRYWQGNEDEGSEKEVLETAAAEWQRAIAAIGRGPVAATVYLPLTAGDDDDRRLPGH